ncbi:MAG: hypothetical protein ACYS0G_09835 [Planctomycetota bacterium]|jgi:hypothetical protein
MSPRIRLCHGLIGLFVLSTVAACGGFHRVKPTPLDQAQYEVPEEQLLDVGVAITQASELSEKQLKKLGTNEDIRKSECHFIPFHLKNTLQMSSYWGSVQVVPPEDDNVDLKVTSELLKSNGELMQFKVEAVDASGRRWLRRKYLAKVGAAHYEHTALGEREAFQDLYNTVANDLSELQRTLSPAEIEQVRTISELKFAGEFSPDAFGDYLSDEDGDGELEIQRLPAADDPLMTRIEKIDAREDMFVDTLNQYYEGFYTQMWEAYENWRRFNQAEQAALRQVEHEALMRTLGGVLLMAAAIALEIGDVPNVEAVSDILILAGGQVVISGVNVSREAEIHAAAIEELGESFGSEMRPTIVELEGKQYELTGTASEQYQRWKDLLRRIYYEETGFDPNTGSADAVDRAPDAVPIDS